MKKTALIIFLFATLLLSCFALTSCTEKYTITWQNWDGTVLEVDYDVEEGVIPSYDGTTPTKQENDQHAYEFAGWDKTVNAASGDTVYTAQFNEQLRSYLIIWKNWDGAVLQEGYVNYGDTPTYSASAPTKEGNARYKYIFRGWSPSVDSVTGSVTYVAQFKEELNVYTVTWKNWDGTVLVKQEYEYDSYPIYPDVAPTREGDAQYSYSFSNWSPDIERVTADVTYTAEYSREINRYEVIWENWDGTLLWNWTYKYGEMPVYAPPMNPTRSSDAQFTYTFSGWSPNMDIVTGNVTYVAQYTSEVRKYTVRWENWNGAAIETDENVEYGTMPVYNGAAPSRDTVGGTVYIFSGWTPSVDAVTCNISYRATFTTETAKYTITWKNWDGTILEVDENVEYGTTPTYDGETPLRAPDAQYTYTFNGWDPWVSTARNDVTYVARFSSTTNCYTVTWKDWDGSVIWFNEVAYGSTPSCWTTPSRPSTVDLEYIFIGWSPEVVPIVDDATYTACYEAKTRKYTITFDAGSGYFGTDRSETLKSIQVNYGEVPSFDEIPNGIKIGYKSVSFTGWDRELEAVNKDTYYYAQYEYSDPITYDVCLAYDHVKGSSNTIALEFWTNGSSSYTIDWGDGTTSSQSLNSYSLIASHQYNQFMESGPIFIYITFAGEIVIEGAYEKNNNIREIYICQRSYDQTTGPNAGLGRIVHHRSYKISKIAHLQHVEFVGSFYKYSIWGSGGGTQELSGKSNIEISNNPMLETVKFASFTYSCYDNDKYNIKECIENTIIDDYGFYKNPNLKTIDFGDCEVSAIGYCAFSGCTSLESINALDLNKVKTIDENAFYDCEKLFEYINLSDTLKEIPFMAFAGCTSLRSVSISSSVTSIGGTAFSRCTNLQYIYYDSTMNDFLKISIASSAFSGCANVQVFCTDGTLTL